ncbi:RNA recognition motif domain-containing protein [Methyloterricola oryzae]|uniref:RNA recognition motif domain-containing protein n=1 Tax=Methyloterricola oryzae TaxID=1495050 RepID=UPI0005EB42DC|nr:RNA-binding protein [Methyloterricola oryzae]
MTKKLYVGNLSYAVTGSDLEVMFAAHGVVASANLITDHDTGRSKGFGFVEMNDAKEAEAAIAALHGKDIDGRNLVVNEARPRESRTGSFSGGGFGSGRRY